MSGLEVNKILASIILAILVVTVIGHLGEKIKQYLKYLGCKCFALILALFNQIRKKNLL